MRFATIAVFYPLLQVAGRISGRALPHQKPVAAPAERDLLSLLGLEETAPTVDVLGGSPTAGIGGGDQNVVQPALPTPITTNAEQPEPTRLRTEALTNPASLGVTPPLVAGNAASTAAAGAAMSTRIGIVSITSQQPDRGFSATSTPSPVGSLGGSGSTTGGQNGSGVNGSDDYVGSDATTTPPAELTEWKVIGIAVMTITLIGTIVLSVTFFDQWWGFLRAVLCGKRACRKRDAEMFGSGGEDMVPDWNRRTWQFKLDSEYGHRYPDMGVFGSTANEKEKAQGKGTTQEQTNVASSEKAKQRL